MYRPFLFVTAFILSCTSISRSQWIQTNGPFGADVRSFAVQGTNIYAGTTRGGVFRSSDNGTSWKQVSYGMESQSIYAITSNGIALYAGGNAGVYLSIDSGERWTLINNGLTLIGNGVHALATIGSSIFAGTNLGVFVSVDNGTNWKAANKGLAGKMGNGISSFATSGNNIFAGTYGGGVFLSTDLGVSWTSVSAGLTNKVVESITIKQAYIFAGTFGGGIEVSTNNGTSWMQQNSGLTDTNIMSLTASGNDVYAGTYWGNIFHSSDNGNNWHRVKNVGSFSVNALASNNPYVFAGNTDGRGVFVSSDQGNSWAPANNGLTCIDLMSFASDNKTLFVASSSGTGIYKSDDRGNTWINLDTGWTDKRVYTLTLQNNTLYAGGEGIFKHRDGSSWIKIDTGSSLSYVNALSNDGGSHLFAGSQTGAYVSTDEGTGWIAINTGAPSTYPITALLVSGSNLLAGARYGSYRSTFSGSICIPIDNALTSYAIQTYSSQDAIIYAGTDYSFQRSIDGGKSWVQPLFDFGQKVSAIQATSNALFLGSDSGVYVSLDSGNTIVKVSDNLPKMFIQGLAIVGTDLFVCGYQNAVWRRPLSEMITQSAIAKTESTSQSLRSYPNPLSQSTTISFTPEASGHADISIVNQLGVEVARIFSGELDAGERSFMWSKPTGMPDGVYECVVRMNGEVQRAGVVLVR
jgi:hypothetical protein